MAQSTVALLYDINRLDIIEQENGDQTFALLYEYTGNGFKSQAEGDRVTFEITNAPKGLQSANVNKL